MRDGVVRWRRRDLQHRIKAEFGVVLHECRAGQATGGTGLSAVVPAPAAPEVGPGSARGVQKNFPEAGAAAIPARAQDKPLEIRFQGEPDQKTVRGRVFPANARVGQQGNLTRIWARRGTRPRAPRTQWAYLFGAVCPARGTAAGLVLPFVNTAAMNAHPAEIARSVAPVRQGNDSPGSCPDPPHPMRCSSSTGPVGANALAVPDTLSLPTPPLYSPELNPVVNVWQYLRANKRAVRVFENYDAIVGACGTAGNRFANDRKTLTSITTRSWAQVNGRGRWYDRSSGQICIRLWPHRVTVWPFFKACG